MGKKVKPITGKKHVEGVAAKSKAIHKAPKDKTVAGFAQKKSEKIKVKGKRNGPKIKKSVKAANTKARTALASGEVGK